MEVLGVIISVIFLVSPIYFFLFRIQGRLTEVETKQKEVRKKINFLYEKNGGKG